ncbi:hypothetical protein FBF31_01355 [Candidatus Saccharibacteria bacterium oral taxon 955]|nr:hypothetical protein FBF33_01350 [Candidatus Saccharibacteria bacterium oral taxon 955]QJU05727.1 hypothetical protein FBF31_01355 [Candidatus Saccharibacteria bacterium oral taxon 955]
MSDDKKAIVDIVIKGKKITIHSNFRFYEKSFCFASQSMGVEASSGYGSYALNVRAARMFDPVKVAANLLLEILGVLGSREVETVESSTNIKVLIEANLFLQESVIESMNKEEDDEIKAGLQIYLEKLENELNDLEEELDDEI